MKKTAFILTFILAFVALSKAQESVPFWLNEKINEENRVPMHASYFVFENEVLATKKNWKLSENYLDINGVWKFKYLESPNDLQNGFEKTTFDDTGWDTFKIPATWDVNGYGFPVYTNTTYDFAKYITINPPLVPVKYNPTGVYRREITIDKSWEGKDIFLHVGSAKSNLTVWVNGIYVGYGEDGKLPQEFNLNAFLKTGKNTITLKVMKWSDGSYLECQDFWRMSGITRESYLYARNKAHLKDFEIIPDLDASYVDGTLKIVTQFSDLNKKDNYTLETQLKDNETLIATKSFKINAETRKLAFDLVVNNPKKWSAEIPNLYQINFILKDKNTLDIGSSTGGFTQILLENDVRHVTCVDVGSNQLHERIKHNPKIEFFENTDIRNFSSDKIFEIVTCDVSFISILNILNDINRLASKDIIILFKPQFEVGTNVKRDKKGVVKDKTAIIKARQKFVDSTLALNWKLNYSNLSKLQGKDGNEEELFYFSK